jgi:methyltransferase (TIGR00027 family)
MKEGKASETAEGVTALRAVESAKPEGERVCYDPLARQFLGTKYRILGGIRPLTSLALWNAERRSPGVFGCITGRTRYIDDCLATCIDQGLRQVVILGAGYDTRAYRMADAMDKVKVFEVDHPATQKVKIEKVRKALGSLPDHVVYVPIDFKADRLDQRLFESGYSRDLKTLFIWEGVTMYLPAEAVDETLDFVVRNSPAGSYLVFNYIFQSVLDGTCQWKYAAKVRKAHERTREPFTFGIPEGAAEQFLSRRGFRRTTNVTGQFFKETYFKGANSTRNVCCLCGFAVAEV